MINNMEGKSYEERLYCLKLWTLEERRNRQDLIEVFKMCNGLSRLKLNDFLLQQIIQEELEDIVGKKLNFGAHGTAVFFRRNQLDQRVVDVSSDNAFKGWLNKTRETRMGFFMD